MTDTETIEQALDEVRQSRGLISNVDAWLSEELRPYIGRRVLELGCGHGNFISRLLECEVEFVGAIDIDPQSVEIVRARFGSDHRFRAKVHDVRAHFDQEIASWRVDTVLSVNMLEHIRDHELAIRRMAELVGGGGHVLVVAPAHPWAFGTMDSNLGHYRRYTKRSMAALMRAAGLVVLQQRYVNAAGLVGWIVNGKLLRRAVPPEDQLRLINAAVPAIRWCEQIVRPPFGTSLLTVACVDTP